MIIKRIFKILQPIEDDGEKFLPTLSISKRIKKIFKKDKNFYSNTYIDSFFLLKQLVLYILAILYLPIILLFFLKKIKIVLINTDQIGAYLHQCDCLSKYSKLNNTKFIFFSSKLLDKFHSCNFHFKKYITIIDSTILYILVLPMTVVPKITFNPWLFETLNENTHYNKIHTDYKNKFKKYNIEFEFDFTETNQYLNSNLIKERNFVCFALKDRYYNYSSVRDTKIKNYLLSINYLIQKDINVIRFINNKSEKLDIDSNKYFELNVELKNNNLLQLGLIQKALFVVCNQSGVCHYGTLTKTPYLLCDAIPINTINVIKNTDRFITKKFFDLKINQFLSIKQIFNLKLNLYPELFALNNQIKIIDNSELEILESVKNMFLQKNNSESFLEEFNNTPGYFTYSKMSENFSISKN